MTTEILQYGSISTAIAADKNGVSRRTIQRDLAEISRVIPIYPDGSGVWLLQSKSSFEISPY